MFEGTYTALITPFTRDGIDWESLEANIEDQVAAGIDGVVPVGTTGESPTLSFEEHDAFIRKVVKKWEVSFYITLASGLKKDQA